MTGSGYDAKWWRHFTAAPPELQRAMHATLKAREILELRTRLGIDDDSTLAEYERRLEELEQTERRIREAAGQDLPLPRSPEPETTSARTPSGADRYW